MAPGGHPDGLVEDPEIVYRRQVPPVSPQAKQTEQTEEEDYKDQQECSPVVNPYAHIVKSAFLQEIRVLTAQIFQ
jgi:hypothetical protein